ncbi:MAG: hypothetical protein EBV27_04215 [Actinobacteria bacterium]|nr:hypothetical protein [Actinomycetota bacterium]
MSLDHLVKDITKNQVWQELTKAIATESIFKIAAPNSIFSFITNHLVNNSDSIVLAVTSNTKEADRLVDALTLWNKEISVANFPAWETLPHEKIEPTKDIVGQRLAVIRRLSRPDNNYYQARKLDVVVAPIRSLMQPILKSLQDLEPLALKPGDSIDLTNAVTKLVELGYERVEIVEKRGEFAVRGGILDIFIPGSEHPLRVDFFGDEVEEIRNFSVADQRSLDIAHNGLWAPACKEPYLNEEFIPLGPLSLFTDLFESKSIVLLSGAEKNNRITASVVLDNSSVSHYVLKHKVQQFGGGIDTVAITSADEFTPQSEPGFPVIKRGITFKDADTNGISTDVVLWGTSANALLLNGQSAGNFVIATAASVDNSITIVGTSANIITSGTRIKFTVNNTDEIIRIEKPVGGQAAILPLATGSIDVGSNSLRYQAVYAQTIYSTTNNATYADLAERYKADASYEAGTVLRIGGTEEVTICNTYEDESYAGIVSANPAYAMNSELGPVERCPYIALKGRVPVKIKGPCQKGQILVTSDFPGHAEVRRPGQRPNPLGVVGKALQDFDGEFGIVEVMV